MGCFTSKSAKAIEPIQSQPSQPQPYSYDQGQLQHNPVTNAQYAGNPSDAHRYSNQNLGYNPNPGYNQYPGYHQNPATLS